jgi:hypothetical protein
LGLFLGVVRPVGPLHLRNQRRVSLDRLAKKLGYGWKKRLYQNKRVSADLNRKLLNAWKGG